jgi:hypothetical protein
MQPLLWLFFNWPCAEYEPSRSAAKPAQVHITRQEPMCYNQLLPQQNSYGFVKRFWTFGATVTSQNKFSLIWFLNCSLFERQWKKWKKCYSSIHFKRRKYLLWQCTSFLAYAPSNISSNYNCNDWFFHEPISINTFDSTSLQAYSWATNKKQQHWVTYRWAMCIWYIGWSFLPSGGKARQHTRRRRPQQIRRMSTSYILAEILDYLLHERLRGTLGVYLCQFGRILSTAEATLPVQTNLSSEQATFSTWRFWELTFREGACAKIPKTGKTFEICLWAQFNMRLLNVAGELLILIST